MILSYIPFDARVFPIFIYYIFLSSFGILITLKMFSNYVKNKFRATLYLFLVFAVLTLALLMLWIGLAEAIITGYYKEVYRFSLPFAYSMVLIADIFLYKFANQLTGKGKKAFVPLLLIGVVLIIILFLPWNWWGVPLEDYKGQPRIRLYSTLGVIAFSYIIYIMIIKMSRTTIKSTDDKIIRVRLNLFTYSIIALILTFVCFIVDNILIVLYDHPGYSEFVYIAWFFALIFLILSYISLFTPSWLTGRIEKSIETE